MTWLIAAASLTGVWLNIHKRRACFALWFLTNSSWAAVDFANGIYAQGALQSVYAGLSVWGWLSWGREREGD